MYHHYLYLAELFLFLCFLFSYDSCLYIICKTFLLLCLARHILLLWIIFLKSSVVISPELVGQQIWLLLLRNINAITCSGYSWQISCESWLCRSFRNYIWRIWYWSRPNAQIKVGYCHPIHRRQGRHFKVCSGSVVVTAYDSESGRPGSNPEWGLMRLRSLHVQGLPKPSSHRGSTLGTRAAEHKGCNWGMQVDWWLQPYAVFDHSFSGIRWHMPQ